MTLIPLQSKSNQPILWGLLHGLNDFAAGYMLANYTFTHNREESFLFIIIYSIIGFGGQLPVGFWLDSKKQIIPFAKTSVILLPLAIAAFFINAEAGIIVSGIASAFIHVTGGAICLQINDQKSGPVALFTAPGVLGLTFGGLLGSMNSLYLLIVVLPISITGFFILKEKLPSYQSQEKKQSELDGHDWLMLGILLVICFRSFLFDVLNHVAQDFDNGVLIIGLSAFAGKIIGGFVADKIGWKKYVYFSLPLALILFQLGKENIYALAFGIASLQSSVPITLMLMGQSLSSYPATATALSLGTSIALAGLPVYLIGSSDAVIKGFSNNRLTAILFSALLLISFIGIKYLRKIQHQR